MSMPPSRGFGNIPGLGFRVYRVAGRFGDCQKQDLGNLYPERFGELHIEGASTLNPKSSRPTTLVYLEGDLVSRLITPITHTVTLNIPIINLLTKSP